MHKLFTDPDTWLAYLVFNIVFPADVKKPGKRVCDAVFFIFTGRKNFWFQKCCNFKK